MNVNQRKDTGLNYSIIFFAAATFLVAIFLFLNLETISGILLISIISIAVLLTFFNTDLAVVFLIFSMLLSPELTIAEVPHRAVVIRVDDILLIVIFFAWLAKMALNKNLSLIHSTPLNLPIVSFIFLAIFSTTLAIAGDRVHPLESFFYILKYIEYFILFFLVSNIIHSKRQIEVFMLAFFITAFLVCLYAFWHLSEVVRVSAPFEGRSGEANTLAGYLLVVMGVIGGLVVHLKPRKVKFFLLGLLVCALVPFLYTLSRGAWLGVIPMFIVLILLAPQAKKPALIVFFVVLLIFSSLFTPQLVKRRIAGTFVPGKIYKLGQRRIALESSAVERVEGWKTIIFNKFPKRPLFGWGVTGVGLVDSNYFLWLGEMGLMGILVFLWIITTIFRHGLNIYRECQDNFLKGLTLGLLLGLTGIFVQGLTANSFIIVRIMEPFWFLTALIFSIPRLMKDELIFNEAT